MPCSNGGNSIFPWRSIATYASPVITSYSIHYTKLYETDQIRFEQVLNNLINNALKFTKEGHVRIGYRVTKDESRSFLEVYVDDTGIGIPDEMKNVIFERFRQVKELDYHEGAGLGLCISKGIVELMGGTIWYESEPGKGSTFFFTIPLKINLYS